MARRPNIERPTSLNLKLPESMRARLDLILWSEVEGCVPKGRYQQFFLSLLQTYFDKLKADNITCAMGSCPNPATYLEIGNGLRYCDQHKTPSFKIEET